MKVVYILCEGPTEERFITDVLKPLFKEKQVYLTPIVIMTKQTASKKYKGGISNYEKIKEQLRILCRNKNALITTMIDYYGLPKDTPGMEYKGRDLYDRVQHIEQSIANDIGADNLICYLSVHEYEALLFSNVDAFNLISSVGTCHKLQAMREKYDTPEHINNSTETAPSKRILKVIPEYAKVTDGTSLAKEIGVHTMKEQCPHFREWINELGK